MEKRIHDKTAGISILCVLIAISLLEVVFRFGCLRNITLSTANSGEPFATMLFAVIILFFTFKGSDRVCYICYSTWIGYFVLDQLMELPGQLATLPELIARSAEGMHYFGFVTWVLRIFSMITIIMIGILLAEYMNDGSIYNKAFNILCASTVLMLSANIVLSVWTAINIHKELMLDAFNCLYRLVMLFLFTFFAYDSAKFELAKVKFKK